MGYVNNFRRALMESMLKHPAYAGRSDILAINEGPDEEVYAIVRTWYRRTVEYEGGVRVELFVWEGVHPPEYLCDCPEEGEDDPWGWLRDFIAERLDAALDDDERLALDEG